MPTKYQADVLAWINQFFPNLLTIITRLYLIVFISCSFSSAMAQERMSDENNCMVFILFTICQAFCPSQYFITRGPLCSNYQKLAPMLILQLISCIFQRNFPLTIRKSCYHTIQPFRVPFYGEIFRKMCKTFITTHISIFMVACSNDIRYFIIQASHTM